MPTGPVERSILHDLVMLGRAAPELISDMRLTVCAAAFSKKHGLVRIYPTTTKSALNTWNIVSVPVERNPADNRPESWKIQGSKSEWDRLHEKIELRGVLPRERRQALIRGLPVTCPETLNRNHVSLGIVKPTMLEAYLGDRPDVPETVQKNLWGDAVPKSARDFDKQPRLRYRCSNCTANNPHDQQLIEIGCYQWMTKHPENPEGMFDNMHISDPSWEKHLLVGNQANHRTSYIVIAVIWWKKEGGGVQMTLME